MKLKVFNFISIYFHQVVFILINSLFKGSEYDTNLEIIVIMIWIKILCNFNYKIKHVKYLVFQVPLKFFRVSFDQVSMI